MQQPSVQLIVYSSETVLNGRNKLVTTQLQRHAEAKTAGLLYILGLLDDVLLLLYPSVLVEAFHVRTHRYKLRLCFIKFAPVACEPTRARTRYWLGAIPPMRIDVAAANYEDWKGSMKRLYPPRRLQFSVNSSSRSHCALELPLPGIGTVHGLLCRRVEDA